MFNAAVFKFLLWPPSTNAALSLVTMTASIAVSEMHRSGVRPSVRPSVRQIHLFPTLIRRAAHTHRDSPGATRDVARVHFSPSITRTGMLVKVCDWDNGTSLTQNRVRSKRPWLPHRWNGHHIQCPKLRCVWPLNALQSLLRLRPISDSSALSAQHVLHRTRYKTF